MTVLTRRENRIAFAQGAWQTDEHLPAKQVPTRRFRNASRPEKSRSEPGKRRNDDAAGSTTHPPKCRQRPVSGQSDHEGPPFGIRAAAPVRKPRRTEARPLVELSDFQPAELAALGSALTADFSAVMPNCGPPVERKTPEPDRARPVSALQCSNCVGVGCQNGVARNLSGGPEQPVGTGSAHG